VISVSYIFIYAKEIKHKQKCLLWLFILMKLNYYIYFKCVHDINIYTHDLKILSYIFILI